jgi:small subunit ribosomal protein S21
VARWRCVIHIEPQQEEEIPNNLQSNKQHLKQNKLIMIIVPVKEGDNIERALKKFKRKTEKTGVIKELRKRQAFEKPSITNRKKMMKAEYVQQLRAREE